MYAGGMWFRGQLRGDFQITRFNICFSETYPDRLLQSLALLSLLNLAWQASRLGLESRSLEGAKA